MLNERLEYSISLPNKVEPNQDFRQKLQTNPTKNNLDQSARQFCMKIAALPMEVPKPVFSS